MVESRFSHLAGPLLRAGVAPRFVSRTLFELDCHFQDLVAELRSQGESLERCEMQAATRVGSDETIIASVLARPELRAWARQWPWVAYTILPVLALIGCHVLALAILAKVLGIAKHVLGNEPETWAALQGFSTVYLGSLLWALPAGAAAVCCIHAIKRCTPLLWPTVGVVVISLLGAGTNAAITVSPLAAAGSLTAGLGFSTLEPGPPLMRVAFTMGIVLALLLRQRYLRERPDLPA